MAKKSIYLEALIRGDLDNLSFKDETDFSNREINPNDYQEYIPAICRYIEFETIEERRENAYLSLKRILLPNPGLIVVDFLIDRINHEHKLINTILLTLTKIKIPRVANLDTLKSQVKSKQGSKRTRALKIFRNIENNESEEFLLNVLRRSDDPFDIYIICKILAKIGSIYSIPVLLAKRTLFFKSEMNKRIRKSMKKIISRMEMPNDLKVKAMDSDFWKMTWSGSKEDFVSFMKVIGLLSNYGKSDLNTLDTLAEIFADEMGVDYAPYTSFKELRICSPNTDIHKVILNLKENIESSIFMDIALNGTAITPSNETIAMKLHMQLMLDYLFTRLRRRMVFSDDDF